MRIVLIVPAAGCSINEQNIYNDLAKELETRHNQVWMFSPTPQNTTTIEYTKNLICCRYHVRTFEKVNPFRKGVASLLMPMQLKWAMKRLLKSEKIDRIVYATPPITIQSAISWAKRRYRASTYLLLKDIWPQGIVDMGIIRKHGITKPLYKFYRNQEKQLYSISERIGCMSPRNMEYLLKENPEINADKVEIAPNSLKVGEMRLTSSKIKESVTEKYMIPQNRVIALYGGNIGIGQGVEEIIRSLETVRDLEWLHVVICGSGTHYHFLEEYQKSSKNNKFTLINGLSKEDYRELLSIADIGLVFLSSHCTVPNFPSRILDYLQDSKPIIFSVDKSTDVGTIAEMNGFGLSSISGDTMNFRDNLIKMQEKDKRQIMGEIGRRYLIENYNIEGLCNLILDVKK